MKTVTHTPRELGVGDRVLNAPCVDKVYKGTVVVPDVTHPDYGQAIIVSWDDGKITLCKPWHIRKETDGQTRPRGNTVQENSRRTA